MKHLHEMTEDEAIDYAHMKVPECCHSPRNEPFPTETPVVHRALWFDAAWEFNEKGPEPYEVRIDPMDGTWGVRNVVKDEWVGDQFYRTKYHALAAVILLTFGKPIP